MYLVEASNRMITHLLYIAEVHDKLLDCMNVVYLRGCERVYLGNMVDHEAFCPKRDDGDKEGAGSLVMHIRSGDIFDPEGEGQHRKGFGQVRVCVMGLPFFEKAGWGGEGNDWSYFAFQFCRRLHTHIEGVPI